jgi:hypothetical protein
MHKLCRHFFPSNFFLRKVIDAKAQYLLFGAEVDDAPLAETIFALTGKRKPYNTKPQILW